MVSLIREKKISMERKWTDRQYHVQENDAVVHKYMKYIVTQINYQHYHLVAHIPNIMVQEG